MANPILKQASANQGGGSPTLENVVGVALAEDTISATQLVADLQSNQNQAKAIQGDLVEGIKANASNDVIIQTTKQNADLQMQNQSNAILQAAGGTTEQVRLMTQLNDQGNEVESLLAEKADIMSDETTGIHFFDHIINSFSALEVTNDIKHAVNKENHTVNRINNISSAQESFARTNNINKKSISDATIAANSRKIEQLATIDAQKQELSNLHNNSQALLNISNADAGVTRSLLQAYELQGKQEARAFQRESMAFERESMNQRRTEWEFRKPTLANQLEVSKLNLETMKTTNPSAIPATIARNKQVLKEYEDGLALEAEQVAQVQRAQSAAGSPIETAEVINSRFDNTATRGRYIELQSIGSTENPTYGSSPAEAFKNFRTVVDPEGTLPLTPKTAVLKEIAEVQQANYAADKMGKIPKDQDALMADYDKATTAVMAVYARDIKSGDSTNPYQAPPMEVLESMKSVQESLLYQRVLKDQAMVEVQPQLVMDHAVAGILAGLLTPEEAAAGVDALFTAAAVHNNTAQGGFNRVGLSEYNQTTYITSITRPNTAYESLKVVAKALPSILTSPSSPFLPAPARLDLTDVAGPFTRPDKLDLMNETEVKSAIIRNLSAQPPKAKAQSAEPEGTPTAPTQLSVPTNMFSATGGASGTN